MITKEAIILAGGLGTRLRGVLPRIPKCMAPIHGKPFLEYVLEYLISQGISKVILSVAYRKDQIINYFDDKYGPLKIEYAIENQPLGTGGAVKLALDICSQDNVYVLNGDTYFIPDLQLVEKLHFQTKADITIAVKYLPDTGRYGTVQMDSDGRITGFREKDPLAGNGWINGGIYLLKKQIFDSFPGGKFSLENDVFKDSCSRFNMQAFRTDADFLDIGIPEDYAKAQTMIKMPGKK
jgi:D-glycero-alpha-D-manno-heptose 1-phosphate guanylyltransferase